MVTTGCGERMHKFKTLERKNGLRADECPFSDWCEKSRLSTLYVVDEKCVCEFCYKICGYVRNRNNMLVGRIEKNGDIRNENNMSIGKVESDGSVRDRNNMLIGKVKYAGTIVDCNNKTIGYAKDVPKTFVAVFFFFKLLEK